jgi:hypothetical protein
MAENLDLSVLISQVPRVQKIQGDIQQTPLSAQEGLQREVEKKQERQQKEIEGSSKGSQSDKVEINKKRKREHREEKKKKKKQSKQKQEKDATGISDRGQILDIEV